MVPILLSRPRYAQNSGNSSAARPQITDDFGNKITVSRQIVPIRATVDWDKADYTCQLRCPMTNAEAFAARLARINDGGPNTNRTIFVGQDEQVHLAKKVMVKKSKSQEIGGNAVYPLSLIGAFCVGLFAVALGYYARFQLMTGQAEIEDADLEMALSGAIGVALSFVLAQMFRLTSKEHKAMQSAGVFAMVCAFHNFAFWAPEPMKLLFSPSYVARIQTEAPPNSARFRGAYFQLFDKTKAATLAADAAPDTDQSACAPVEPTVKRVELNSAKKKSEKPAAAPCEGG